MLRCNGLIGPVGYACVCVRQEDRKRNRDAAEPLAPSTSAPLLSVFASGLDPQMKPSIHLLPRVRGGLAGAAAWAGKPRLPSLQPIPLALPGGSRGVPRDIVPSACPGSSREPPTGGTCPERLTRSGRPPNQTRTISSTLSSSWVPELLTLPKGEPSHPAEEAHFSRL